MFRNLIFDWSGTLVDDLGPVIEATNAVLCRYGLAPMDRENFRRQFRLPYREFYAEILPDVPLDELESHFRPAFRASTEPVTILPHSREKLDWCRDLGIRCFVLTSMDESAFADQLAQFELEQHFVATYAGVLDKRDVIHQILNEHQLNPAETAFVGDMTHDVETARHGGVASVAVLTGYNHPEILASASPDLIVSDLRALRDLLDRRPEPYGPVATVGALIEDGRGRILMIRTHKWHNLWGIPGGKIRRGESHADALHREIREETALEISEPRLVMVQDSINSPEFMRPEHFLLLNYLVHSADTHVILNDEAEEFCWLTPNDALALDLNQPTRSLIEHCLNQNLI